MYKSTIILSLSVCMFAYLCLVSGHSDENLYKREDNEPAAGNNADGQNKKMPRPESKMRYLLYDVNPGEGFNLRRDVYMRVCNLVKFLNEDGPWTLVLPPWGRLYHWQTPELRDQQTKIPWENFFDVYSLGMHCPVIEFTQYWGLMGTSIEQVYYLQRFAEGWKDGKWEEKIEVRDCIDEPRYRKDENGQWIGQFFGYEKTNGKNFDCLSAQSSITTMKTYLLEKTKAKSIFLDRAETLIHGQFSEWSKEYWTVRRSMVFAESLRRIGDKFRKDNLDSTDKKDKTELLMWTKMKREHGYAKGGPYLAVHLRRKDYLYAHGKEVPSIENAAKQIKKYLDKYDLKKVFVATDAKDEEYEDLKDLLKGFEVYRYKPSTEKELKKLKDGGVAIIDQWICAHAKVFVGSYVSTFTFRIHEEREILGFEPNLTFNRFCGDEEQENCEQPTQWKIVY